MLAGIWGKLGDGVVTVCVARQIGRGNAEVAAQNFMDFLLASWAFFLESWDLAFKDMDLIWRLCHGGLGVLGHGAVFLGQFSAGSEQILSDA